MEKDLSQSLVQLGTQELFRVRARGRSVVVFHGRIWVTQDGDTRDIILAAGDSFTFDRAGLALIEALEPSTIAVFAEVTAAAESIGYEAAWPQTEPALAQPTRQEVEEQARRMPLADGARAARSLARAARRVWRGATSTPLRHAA